MNYDSTQESVEPRRSFRPTGRLVGGLIVITLGVLFTLDNLNLIDARDYLRYWPVALMALGATKIAFGRGSSERFGGFIWLLIGGWMLLHNLDMVSISIWKLWPLFLILLGIRLVMGGASRGSWQRGASSTDDGATFNSFALMGGVDRKFTSQTFRGGDATALMGGVVIDLRQAVMEDGKATIDVFAFWGGIDLIVPGDWTVRVDTMPIMGSVEDNRRDVHADPAKLLVLRGAVVMGGVEIKN